MTGSWEGTRLRGLMPHGLTRWQTPPLTCSPGIRNPPPLTLGNNDCGAPFVHTSKNVVAEIALDLIVTVMFLMGFGMSERSY